MLLKREKTVTSVFYFNLALVSTYEWKYIWKNSLSLSSVLGATVFFFGTHSRILFSILQCKPFLEFFPMGQV